MREDREIFSSDDEPITLSIKNDVGMLYVLPDNAQGIGCRDEQQDYFA